MKLEKELKLPKPLKDINHETLLSILRTHSLLMKRSANFFSNYEVTDVQFNILMILYEYSPDDGMSQQKLSEKLIVSKSNVVGLVDRLEKNAYLERKGSDDRRINKVVITPKGKRLVSKIYDLYFKEVNDVVNCLSDKEKKSIIVSLGKIRDYLKRNEQWKM